MYASCSFAVRPEQTLDKSCTKTQVCDCLSVSPLKNTQPQFALQHKLSILKPNTFILRKKNTTKKRFQSQEKTKGCVKRRKKFLAHKWKVQKQKFCYNNFFTITHLTTCPHGKGQEHIFEAYLKEKNIDLASFKLWRWKEFPLDKVYSIHSSVCR